MPPKESIKLLREQIAELITETDAIVSVADAESRDLSDEDRSRIDEVLGAGDVAGEIAGLQGQLTRWEKIEAARNAIVDTHGIREALTEGGQGENRQLAGNAQEIIHATARRYGANSLRSFKGDVDGVRAEERAYRFGMYALAMVSRCLPHRYDFPGAVEFTNQQILNVAHGSEGTTGAHVTVPDEFSSDIIDLKETRGVVRQLFGRDTMISDTKLIPRRATGLTTFAVGENAAGTESNTTQDNIQLVARKWMTLARLSKELDEDNAIGFGDMLASEIAYSQADKEDESGFNGDGTSTFHGIVGARAKMQDFDGAGTDSVGLITQGTGNTWSAIVQADFSATIAKLPDFGDTPATVWVCHRTFFYEVMEPLAIASGGTSAAEVREGERRSRPVFRGYPVEFSQVFPKVTAVATVSVLLGDFNIAAVFADRRMLEIEFSDQVYVNNESVWERDQIAVKGTQRYDIKVHSVGDATDAGAIVALETGA